MSVRLQRLRFAIIALLVMFNRLQAQEKTVQTPTKADVTAAKADAKLPDYKVVKGISGDMQFNGSDTMIGEVTLLAESFKKLYGNVTIGIEGEGSSFGPPALISGKAQFIAMSRAMKAKEVMRIGRNRNFAPSMAASLTLTPCWCRCTANSTMRIAFLAARPISMTRPICA